MTARGMQIINGTEYVYEYVSVWDPIKKRPEQKRNYIGKNVNGMFVPNKKYELQQQIDCAKSEAKPGPVPATVCKRLFYGATYLLDSIGQNISLTEQELLDELDIIEYYQQPGRRHHLSEITEKQKQLYRDMKVQTPT